MVQVLTVQEQFTQVHTEVSLFFIAEIDTPTIRLADGRTRNKGRVEVYRDGRWGTICYLPWGPWGRGELRQDFGFPMDETGVVVSLMKGSRICDWD